MKTIAPRIIFTILFIVVQVVFVPTLAQKRNENRLVEIEIVPNRSDRTYKLGEDVTFEVRAYRAGVALSGVSLTYAIGSEKMPSTLSGSVVMQDKCVQLDAGTMTVPGFMTCSCTIEMEGESYSNYVNVGFSPEEIVPTQTMPDDFEKFWDKSLKKSAKIPLEPQLTLVPEKCTAKTNVYHVQLQHWRKDTYLYGWLCVPKKEGRYPAVLCVPGAGVKPVPPELKLAEMGNGVITFSIGVNGIPLTLDNEVYDNLRYGVLRDYGFIHLDNKDHYYYRRIYTGCVRALDFICTLPCYDGNNLGVMGGSQGGALAMVTASLDSRVKALVAFYPALCDVTGYLHGRAGGWPHMFDSRNMKLNNTPEKISTTQYYDVVNFARRLQVPGYYSWGYNDPTCPPTSLYAAYNVIAAPKQLYVAHDAGHWRYPEQTRLALKWLYERLSESK